METRLMTAIIFCTVQQVNGSTVLKYRNIKDTEKDLQKFKLFAAKFPGADYINWYDKKTRAFIKREYLRE